MLNLKQLEKLDRIDTDSSTHLGTWFGGGGFIVTVICAFISIYTTMVESPNLFWVAISGWVTASIATCTLMAIAYKLIRIALTQFYQVIEIQNQLDDARAENKRLIDIDSYIVSKAIRTKTKSHTDSALPKKTEGAINVD